MEVLTVKNLTKKYGNIEVLKNVNMHIQEGEIGGGSGARRGERSDQQL